MHDLPSASAPPSTPTTGPVTASWPNRFLGLGAAFHTRLVAEPLPAPHWVATSPECAALLGLPADWATRADFDALAVFSGNAVWPGMAPLASVYSGHQFGVWAGQLGDGRALWLGELDTTAGPLELQLKGAGRTPYSRHADGRAVLRSSIREFLCSEAMAALGIPTTRALCITGSPQPVRREAVETAAVVTRVAPSFIRFGHFEHFAHTANADGRCAELKALTDHVIAHHYPDCASAVSPVLALLEAVARRTAVMVAGWQSVGFCHGVMNTDNMSVLGLTIDYGPYGFVDAYDPGHICNHSDHQGRYAFGRQPNVALWNLHALAQALLPLIAGDAGDVDPAETAIDRDARWQTAHDAALEALECYQSQFAAALASRMRAKLGLAAEHDGDLALVEALLTLMAKNHADFTLTFHRLAGLRSDAPLANDGVEPVRDLFLDRDAFDAWAERYAERLQAEGSNDAERRVRMRACNPRVVLRNHLAQTAIQRAEAGDFSEVARLHAALARPFDDDPETADYAALPPDWAQHIEVSCSS